MLFHLQYATLVLASDMPCILVLLFKLDTKRNCLFPPSPCSTSVQIPVVLEINWCVDLSTQNLQTKNSIRCGLTCLNWFICPVY